MDYDLLVIGGGAAGLTAAGLGAQFGAKTLLVEQHRLGGDCTWTGCIPSKTLIRAAQVAWQAQHASKYGLADQPFTPDTRSVMAHVRRTREEVYEEADRPEYYERLGATVRRARARFIDPHTVELSSEGETERVTARYLIIVTGARPAIPAVEGLREIPFLTSETLFELEELPRRIAILGTGAIGTEMAQALARLGSEVMVIHRGARILPKDDPELAGMLQSVLESEGVTYLHSATLARVRKEGGRVELTIAQGEAVLERTADALLVATGRTPNVEYLGLEAAGVTYSAEGIMVDDHCRTSAGHIYAAGDVTGRYQFTHMSEHMAKVAATNALLKWPVKIDTAHVPWVTYTDPELAHIGATEAELQLRGTRYAVYRFPFSKIDRAVTDGETIGWIKVYATRRTGKILGADILGVHAGGLICELALAMRNGLSLRQIADTIHPYPTLGLGVRRAADQWYVGQYNPTLIRALQKVFRYRGPVIPPEPGEIL